MRLLSPRRQRASRGERYNPASGTDFPGPRDGEITEVAVCHLCALGYVNLAGAAQSAADAGAV